MADPNSEPLRWGMTLPNGQPLRYGMAGAKWGGTVGEVMQALQNQTTPPRMSQNLISATLAETLANELIADFQAIRVKQAAFIMALSAQAKAELLKMGLGNMAVEVLMRTAATENPGELASNFPLADWDEDRAFAAAYRPVVAVAQKLASDMEDTLFAADSDKWTTAMEAYGDIKHDGVGPAIDQAREIMRQRRRGSGGSTPPAPPTP